MRQVIYAYFYIFIYIFIEFLKHFKAIYSGELIKSIYESEQNM